MTFKDDLAQIPKIKRGFVYCHTCGWQEKISADNFFAGWPECCGYTMSLDTPKEREAHIRKANGND